jgi:uncharacterized protein (DUF1778 family)
VAHRSKSERFDARITKEQKELLERAAALEGTTITDFVVRNSERAAMQTIREHEIMTLSVRDTQAVMQALLDPPEPNAVLREAFTHHRHTVGPRRRSVVIV